MGAKRQLIAGCPILCAGKGWGLRFGRLVRPSLKDVPKKFEEIEDGDTEATRTLEHLKVKIEVSCKTQDVKQIAESLKILSRLPVEDYHLRKELPVFDAHLQHMIIHLRIAEILAIDEDSIQSRRPFRLEEE